MPNIPDARKRILDAATRIIAEKSFEGSRIDDIAKTANVPKSLIYYHFKNKDRILETIIEDFLIEYQKLLHQSNHSNHETKWEVLVDQLNPEYITFIHNNVDIIRIIMIESLKKTIAIPPMFKVVEELIKNDDEKMKSDSSYDLDERLIAEFFTGLIPIFSFLCFQEQWSEYFKVNSNRFNNFIIDLITETHGHYHKKYTQNNYMTSQRGI